MRRIVATCVIAAVLVVAGGTGTTGPESTAKIEAVAMELDEVDSSEARVSAVFAASGDLVGATWDSGVPDGVEIRALQEGSWTDWRELGFSDEHAPDPDTAEAERVRPGTEPTTFHEAEAVQFRTFGEELPGLEAVFVEVQERSVLPVAASASAAVSIQPRSAWDPDNDCPPREIPEEIQVNTAIIHHTGLDRYYSKSSVPGIILGYCLYHRNGRGYDDIAYNFLIDEYGTIWEGRAGGIEKGIRGGHSAGFSSYSTGIALIGNYTREYPSLAQQKALTDLLAWKLSIHNIDPNSSSVVVSQGSYKWDEGVPVTLNAISGHRDAQATACPGTYCYNQFGSYRSTVASQFSAWPTSTYDPIVVGDFTGDGVEDGAAFGTFNKTWSVFNGSTDAISAWDDGSNATYLVATAADLDGNARQDIVAAKKGSLYELVSTGSSFSASSISVSGTPMAILRPNSGSGETTAVVMTNGSVLGGSSLTQLASIPNPVDAAVGDLDGDGSDEIIVLDSAEVIHVVSTDGTSGLHGVEKATGTASRIVSADFLGVGSDSIASIDMDYGVATLYSGGGSGLASRGTLDFDTPDHLTEVFADEYSSPARLMAVDAFIGQWKTATFTAPVPLVTILEDQSWRTHVVRGANSESRTFLAWYGREFGWIRSEVGVNANEDVNATVNLSGASRYSTNVTMSRLVHNTADHVVLATSERFPDALTAGVVATETDAALLLTAEASLPLTIRSEILRLGASHVTIAGGPMAVGPAVEAELVDLGLTVERIGGADRYETAVMLSRATFDSSDTVYVATGLNYPDALAAVPAASERSAPVLLVSDQLPPVVAAEIDRLSPSEIIILGGPVAVSESVAAAIEAATGITPSRLGGADRIETAIKVSRSVFGSSTEIVFVTRGEGFIDAILTGPVAHYFNSPLLLAWDVATGSLLSELERLGPERIVLVGGGLDNEDSVDSFDSVGPSLSTETVTYAPRP